MNCKRSKEARSYIFSLSFIQSLPSGDSVHVLDWPLSQFICWCAKGAGPYLFVNIIFKKRKREILVSMLVLYLKYYTQLDFILNVI